MKPFLFLSLLVLCLSVARAGVTEELQSVTNNRISIFDADPPDDFSTLQATFRVRTALQNPPLVYSARYRISYQLLDPQGDPITLVDGSTTGFSDEESVTLTLFAINPQVPMPEKEFDLLAKPDPLATLDPKSRFTIQGQLQTSTDGGQNWTNVAGEVLTTDPFGVLHFTNTQSGDAEWNIRAGFFDLQWERTHALATSDTIEGFEASVGVLAARRDDIALPPADVDTTLILDFDLIEESSGDSVPLVGDGIVTRDWTATSHNGADPAGAGGIFLQSITANLVPIGQLESAGESYFLRCTLRHEEDAQGTLFEDMSCDLAAEKLLHFNGNLLFGSLNTTFTGFANVPIPGAVNAAGISTFIRLANNSGEIPNRPEYAFGNGAALIVTLTDEGTAIVTAGQQPVVNPDDAVAGISCLHGGLVIRYGGVVLNNAGATATGVMIDYPQGLNVMAGTNAFLAQSGYNDATATLTLNDHLCPPGDLTFTLPAGASVTDESHPVRFAVTGVNFLAAGGIEFDSTGASYLHESAYNTLAAMQALLASPDMADRQSNDRYLLEIDDVSETVRFTTAADATIRLTATLEVAATSFQAHFPSATRVNFTASSTISIVNGYPQTSELQSVSSVTVPYLQTCEGDDCTDDIDPVQVRQRPDDNSLALTPTGGLHSFGTITSGNGDLQWGIRAPGQYSQRTDEFTEGWFHMPGYQLYQTDNAVFSDHILDDEAADQAPAALLLCAFNRDDNDPQVHVYSEPGYISGDGDLAGLNFEVTGTGFGGATRIAGEAPDYAYELLEDQGNGGSKYYIRQKGVNGRQVGRDGTYAPELDIKGFPATIERFQYTFLDNSPDHPAADSWIDGVISVSGFSNWSQQFTALKLDCLGEPQTLTPNLNEADGKSLSYWNSSFDLKSLTFVDEEEDGCPKKYETKLAAGAELSVANINQLLQGPLVFCPNGNLTTGANPFFSEEFNNEPLDSRLRIPPTIPLTGPNKDYHLVPTGKLRFNNPEAPDDPPSPGFVTFSATIDIPYFVDLEVQAITSAAPSEAPLYLTPGWKVGDNSFFNDPNFDADHTGFPEGSISYQDYLSPQTGNNIGDEFFVTARQDLFGFIPLAYPLAWDPVIKRFTSKEAIEQDIFVARMEHKVDYLDAQFANISFGAEFDGLPVLNLSNFLNNQIDQAADAIAGVIENESKKAIDTALDRLDQMLQDSLDRILDPVIDQAAAPIEDLYSRLQGLTPNEINTYLETAAANPADPTRADLEDLFDLIGAVDATEEFAFTTQLDQALEKIIIGIDAITQGVDVDGEGIPVFSAEAPTNPDIRGLLYEENGERQIIGALIDVLLTQLVEPDLQPVISELLESASSGLNEELNALLVDIDPTLDQVRLALLRVRDGLVALRNASGIISKIAGVVETAKNGPDLDRLLQAVITRTQGRFSQVRVTLGVNATTAEIFQELTPDNLRKLLRDEIRDSLLQSDLMQQLQFLLRQSLYDVQTQVTTALSSVLAQISEVIKQSLSGVLQSIDDSLTSMLGDIGGSMASGSITGYAEINGDSLRKLRLDLDAQISMPDEMSLHVYLEILQYSSEDNFVQSGCIDPGEKMVEVRIGANDVGIAWISDMRIDLEVKVSLSDFGNLDVPVPIGVGGKFEMTGGELNFQTFKILEFGATMAVGLKEAYLGAKARAIFSSYEIAAAIFFGRTCTLEPLLFVDPDIGDVVEGGTTLTGAYVYGEVSLPLLEIILGIPATCMLRIDATIGAGAFFFLEGPVIGGKMLLGISGEALCLVSIAGQIKMIMASQAGTLRGAGTGKFTAELGRCPFCIKFSKTLKIKYDDGDWSTD